MGVTNDTRVSTRGIYKTVSDVIANAGVVSTGIDKRGFSTLGLILPTITSGSVGFDVSTDGTTYVALHDPAGTRINLGTTTGSCAIASSPFDNLEPWPYVRLTMGAAKSGSATAYWVLLG